MLQVILEPNDRFSIAEQAQMAIEGGATWLILRYMHIPDGELRETAAELVPLCRENGTILTFEGNVEMACETGVHGLFLHFHDDAVAVRAQMGPEAIIGVESEVPERIVAYDKADIDYVAMTMEQPAEVIAEVRRQGCLIPFVAYGDYTIAEARRLRTAGYDGICTGRHIFRAEDPVEYVREMLRALSEV